MKPLSVDSFVRHITLEDRTNVIGFIRFYNTLVARDLKKGGMREQRRPIPPLATFIELAAARYNSRISDNQQLCDFTRYLEHQAQISKRIAINKRMSRVRREAFVTTPPFPYRADAPVHPRQIRKRIIELTKPTLSLVPN